MVCYRAKARTSGRPGTERELQKHREKGEGSTLDTASQGHREAELELVLPQTESFGNRVVCDCDGYPWVPTGHMWQEGASAEELPPLDWSVAMSVGYFFDW